MNAASASDAREQIVQRLLAVGAVAVIRMDDARQLVPAVEAIYAGGISAVEITMTMPGALGGH